jgi:signal transduction histidine kinase
MKVLLVEDNPGDARLLREMFREDVSFSATVTHVETMSAVEAYLAGHGVDIILLDLGLPDAQGLGALRRAHAAAPHVPLLVLTGLDDELLAVQALQEGAQDYLVRGQIETRGLLRAMRYAIARNVMEVKINDDVTELKRLGRQLEQAREAADDANQAKSRFLAGITHELRTPLHGILGYAELLSLEGGLNPTQSERLDAMMVAGQYLLGTINAVLDMSQIEVDQMELRPVEIELPSFVRTCLNVVRPAAEAKGLALGLVPTNPLRLSRIPHGCGRC